MPMQTETVHYRLLVMPCCQFRLLWIEAQLPAFCPTCGTALHQYPPLRAVVDDPQAQLTYTDQ